MVFVFALGGLGGTLFPWNAEFNVALSMKPEEALDFLEERFSTSGSKSSFEMRLLPDAAA